jgi:hypothetical protein|eukprot:COSAG01_NODE_2583_length_7421_cov_3.605163_6_plen_67_part_00
MKLIVNSTLQFKFYLLPWLHSQCKPYHVSSHMQKESERLASQFSILRARQVSELSQSPAPRQFQSP